MVASFRTDDQNANRSSASNLHQFYITTKVGPVNVKAGDFYSTIGLGAWSKGEKSTDALSLSTKVGPVTLGIYTTNGGEVATITTAIAPVTATICWCFAVPYFCPVQSMLLAQHMLACC
ncbi:hypothetical protein BSPWISOXPB_10469 [uncultured Gammaproteobacteria bacterium]|nr:hypothetical protein BSPWISOXPB_10469 [uncultured Gammaproteobacteria bacterium]